MIEKYFKKYAELSLTGNIPLNPKFLYEYDLPKDCKEAIELVPYLEGADTSFDIYLNEKNDLVIATNTTPIVLCYKPYSLIKDIKSE